MRKTWADEAWEDYLFYQRHDRRALDKINKLLKDIERNGEKEGIGHPEPLKGNLSGFWSRQVDGKNRLVYRIAEGHLEIAQCRTHYGDK